MPRIKLRECGEAERAVLDDPEVFRRRLDSVATQGVGQLAGVGIGHGVRPREIRSRATAEQIENIRPQLRRIIGPVAVEFPAGAARLAPVIFAPFLNGFVRRAQA